MSERKKGSLVERVAVRYLQSSWDEYDEGEEIYPPSEIIDEKVGLLSKQVKPLVKKMLQTYKRMGFKVRIWDNGGDFDTYEENLTTIMYQFELSLKGGQKIVIDRKQMVASGNYKFEFDAYFHSDDDTEIEKGDENYEEQIDVDEFNEYPTWYYVPSGDFDYFSLGSDDLERFGKREYSAREIEKACKESVYFLFKDLSGKWRKKRASGYPRLEGKASPKGLEIAKEYDKKNWSGVTKLRKSNDYKLGMWIFFRTIAITGKTPIRSNTMRAGYIKKLLKADGWLSFFEESDSDLISGYKRAVGIYNQSTNRVWGDDPTWWQS